MFVSPLSSAGVESLREEKSSLKKKKDLKGTNYATYMQSNAFPWCLTKMLISCFGRKKKKKKGLITAGFFTQVFNNPLSERHVSGPSSLNGNESLHALPTSSARGQPEDSFT